jgi:hypothetical protein
MRQIRCGQLTVFWLAAALLGLVTTPPANAGVTGGAGIGDITYHNADFFTDTTGPAVIPLYAGKLDHEVWAPGGAEHSYMAMTWDNAPPNPLDVFITPMAYPDTTKLDMMPGFTGHHHATMTGTFSVTYTLDGAGLPSVTLPARSYTIWSYIDPYTDPYVPPLFRTSSASFEAHWDYTDVDASTLLGSQDIVYTAPLGLTVIGTASSDPLTISIPAGNTQLKVSGYFRLTADSDDPTIFNPVPYDTLIAVVPEPATLSLLALGALAFFRRRRA